MAMFDTDYYFVTFFCTKSNISTLFENNYFCCRSRFRFFRPITGFCIKTIAHSLVYFRTAFFVLSSCPCVDG